ncbi:MAG: hypothetical protein IJF74_04260 [Clostridia bacterium]|nr:hypothetical protein [Clostridia bacterium]
MKLFDNKKTLLLLIAAAFGVLLMVLGGGSEKEKNDEYSDEAYAAYMESELLELCSSVAGVSDCRVAVSFSGGFTYHYSTRGDIVSVDYPKVCGVAIVCRGGDVPTIEQELVSLVSAYLGLGASQISVSGK